MRIRMIRSPGRRVVGQITRSSDGGADHQVIGWSVRSLGHRVVRWSDLHGGPPSPCVEEVSGHPEGQGTHDAFN